MMYAVMFYNHDCHTQDIIVRPEMTYVVEGDGYYDAMKRLEVALGYKPWKTHHYFIEEVDGFIFSADEDAPE